MANTVLTAAPERKNRNVGAILLLLAVGMVGGAMIAAGLGWGIYLVTAGHVLLLVAVIDNAWSIMVGVGRKA